MTQQEITKVAETMEVSTHAHETYDASGKHTMTEIRGQWAGLMACRVFEDLAVSDPQTFERSPLYLSAVRAIAETIIERIEHSMETITDSGISTEPAPTDSAPMFPDIAPPEGMHIMIVRPEGGEVNWLRDIKAAREWLSEIYPEADSWPSFLDACLWITEYIEPIYFRGYGKDYDDRSGSDDTCPRCRSTLALDFQDFDVDSGEISQRWSCTVCFFMGYDVYTLDRAVDRDGHVITRFNS